MLSWLLLFDQRVPFLLILYASHSFALLRFQSIRYTVPQVIKPLFVDVNSIFLSKILFIFMLVCVCVWIETNCAYVDMDICISSVCFAHYFRIFCDIIISDPVLSDIHKTQNI